MQPKIILDYDNLNQLRQEENINQIRKCAELGKVRVNVVDCAYIISKNKSLQMNLADTANVSSRSVATIQQKLTEFFNIKIPSLDVTKLTITSNDNIKHKKQETLKTRFNMLASKKLQSIDNLTNLLASIQLEVAKIDAKFKATEKNGGAYADAILRYDELLNEYNDKKGFIKKKQHQLYIEKNQLEKIKQLYNEYTININQNDFDMQKSIYEFACIECHYLEQQKLMEEVANIAENIVSTAKKNNATIIFLGRSLIACTAYIEKNHPDIQVVKIPVSGAKKILELNEAKKINKICGYINSYLTEVPATNNLLIVDYVNSGGGLAAVKNITNINGYQDRTTYIAIHSKYSDIKTNKELHKNGNISKSISFNHFLQVGGDEYSPFANALHNSAFDGVSPYGKYEITEIGEDQPQSQSSQDGFNLLKKLS